MREGITYQGIETTSTPSCSRGRSARSTARAGSTSEKSGESIELTLLLGGECLAWLDGTHAALDAQRGCQSRGGEGGEEGNVGVHFEKKIELLESQSQT